MNVGIIFGGPSVEHDISVITARQVYMSLDKKKYNIIVIYYSKDKKFYLVKNFASIQKFNEDINLLEEVDITRLGVKKRGNFRKLISIDTFVCAFHGKNTESGELAGFFQTLGIPYTSSSVIGASIGQDKIIMKKILMYDNINTLPFVEIRKSDFVSDEKKIIDKIIEMDYPLIVKPSNLGSSIGINIVSSTTELVKMLNYAFKYDEYVLVEKCLTNYREFNCAIFQGKVSKIEEVKNNNRLYSFNDKYMSNKERQMLTDDDKELEDKIIDLTIKTSKSLRNDSIARVDFLYDIDKDIIYVNEINTIPGSLSFYLFEEVGIYFSDLLDLLIVNSFKKNYNLELLQNTYTSEVLNNSNQRNMK